MDGREYLIEMRTQKGLTQREISKQLGISESYYNLIENGIRQKNMNVTTLYRLSEVLQVSITMLVDKEINFMNMGSSKWLSTR